MDYQQVKTLPAISGLSFGSIDQASRYVVNKLEKQRRATDNWSSYITCLTDDAGNKLM